MDAEQASRDWRVDWSSQCKGGVVSPLVITVLAREAHEIGYANRSNSVFLPPKSWDNSKHYKMRVIWRSQRGKTLNAGSVTRMGLFWFPNDKPLPVHFYPLVYSYETGPRKTHISKSRSPSPASWDYLLFITGSLTPHLQQMQCSQALGTCEFWVMFWQILSENNWGPVAPLPQAQMWPSVGPCPVLAPIAFLGK